MNYIGTAFLVLVKLSKATLNLLVLAAESLKRRLCGNEKIFNCSLEENQELMSIKESNNLMVIIYE
jgi:hypothetical protein